MPYDIDVEQALLGALLTDNHWFDRITNLKPLHFYDPLHQRMYEQMLVMWGKGMAVTPLTLKAMMANDEGLAEIGGQPYFVSLARAALSLPNVRDYAKILINLDLRRQLIIIGEDITTAASGATADMTGASIASEAAERLFLASQGGEAKPAVSMESVGTEILKIHERRLAGERFPVVKTGLYKLDDELGGFRGGDLIVIAGRSGMGKSALMGGIAVGAAMRGTPVIVFSLEMGRMQWVERTLCDLDFYENGGTSALEYRKFRNGTATEAEFDRLAFAHMRLVDLPIFITDDDRVTIDDIAARARAFAIACGRSQGLVVADYMQIVQPRDDGRDRGREQEVAGIARGCKSLAKRLDWPVVVGAQLLNKGLGKGVDAERRPNNEDIRETGGIEQEADVILMPYRPGFYMERRRAEAKASSQAEWAQWQAEYQTARTGFELLCRKNRHGRLFDLELWCEMASSSIRDQAPSAVQAAQQEALGLLA